MSHDFPLPSSDPDEQPAEANPAAELIRQKIDALYKNEPDAFEEAVDLAAAGPAQKPSKHQGFMLELLNSGKSVADVQTEWHDYYAGLPDDQKHQVWQEFYQTHAAASKALHSAPVVLPSTPGPQFAFEQTPGRRPARTATPNNTTRPVRRPASRRTDRGRLGPSPHLRSLVFGLSVGSLSLVVLLFGLFNERFIAPLITPSKSVTNTPIISGSDVAVGPEPKILIPKINVEIPVVYDEKSVDEAAVQRALERGVVHYADTALPGENGNAVIVGHSSNNIFNRGQYKFAFVLLKRLEKEDSVILHKDGKRYVYRVYDKRVVKPSQLEVLGQQPRAATVTLITCDPPGTSLNRLVVFAEQISPDPTSNLAARTPAAVTESKPAILPSNAPSLWSRMWRWQL